MAVATDDSLTPEMAELIDHLLDSLDCDVPNPRGDGGGTIFRQGDILTPEEIDEHVELAKKVVTGDLDALFNT